MAAPPVGDDALRAAFEAYLLKHHAGDLRDALARGDDHGVRLDVDALRLTSAMPRLVNALFSRPRAVAPLLDLAAVSAQARALAALEQAPPGEPRELHRAMSVKRRVRVRVDLERLACPGASPSIARVRARHAGRLLTLTGTVVRAGAVKSQEVEQLLACDACGHRFVVRAEREGERPAERPSTCPSSQFLEQQGSSIEKPPKPCVGSSFTAVNAGRPIVGDVQEVRVQESAGGEFGGFGVRAALGAADWTLPSSSDAAANDGMMVSSNTAANEGSTRCAPRSMTIVLEDDLADACVPGDDVCVSVATRWRWHRAGRDRRAELELVADALALRVVRPREAARARVRPEDVREIEAFWAEHEDPPGSRRDASALRGRDVVLRSACPQMWGMKAAKLAVALSLMGGRFDEAANDENDEPEPTADDPEGVLDHRVRVKVKETGGGGSSVRGDAHLLLVGDPGMGKSQFLRYAARAAPRAVLTTGTGSTAAGLTAAAVRSESDAGGGSSSRGDESRWTLEAGALVLADGGACCVDEFDTIAPGERAAIHEAMEQQTLSVAKAGIVATLRARCAVLAATNPRGFAFDPQRSLAENTGLAPPLLSRFDCVLVLRDERDPERDERAATHMLASHRGVRATGAAERRRNRDASRPSKRARTASSAPGPKDRGGALLRAETIDGDRSDPEEEGSEEDPDSAPAAAWSFERLRRYFALARCVLNPVLSPEAEALIRGYYQARRRRAEEEGGGSRSRPTIRLLESLVRLTRAHARLMWRNEAKALDAVAAVDLVDASERVRGVGLDEEDDAEAYYARRERELARDIADALAPR